MKLKIFKRHPKILWGKHPRILLGDHKKICVQRCLKLPSVEMADKEPCFRTSLLNRTITSLLPLRDCCFLGLADLKQLNFNCKRYQFPKRPYKQTCRVSKQPAIFRCPVVQDSSRGLDDISRLLLSPIECESRKLSQKMKKL